MALLGGCGNSGGETTPPPLQTGDTPFTNNGLLVSPADAISPQAIILDARNESEYNAGHIPGAISAPTIMFEDQAGVLLNDTALEGQLGKLGITLDSEIIIYDKATDTNSAAGRLFWILKYMGCNDVSILNGGWDKWIAYDHVGTTAPTVPLPKETVFTKRPNDTAKIALKADIVKHFLNSTESGYVLIDVRTKEEYEIGHIPGAVNFPYYYCFNPDKTVLKVEELKPLLAPYIDKEMIVYSNKNHRGGFFYFLCQLMNYPNVTIYLGSIEDWTEANPVVYPLVTGSDPYISGK
jgi:thiosulfate/3-mercaptopyruvate sulfurtransferase